MKRHLPLPRQLQLRPGVRQRQLNGRARTVVPQLDAVQAVAEIHGAEDPLPANRQRTRSLPLKRHAGLGPVQEAQIIDHLLRMLRRGQALHHFHNIHHHQFVRAGHVDAQPAPVSRHRDAPRVRRAPDGIVQQHRIHVGARRHIKHRHRAGVDPAAVEVCGRHREPSDGVGHVTIPPVRAHHGIPHREGAGRQVEGRHRRQCRAVKHVEHGKDMLAVGGHNRQVIADPQRLAILGEAERRRLAHRFG